MLGQINLTSLGDYEPYGRTEQVLGICGYFITLVLGSLGGLFLYPNFIYFTVVKRYDLSPGYCKILGLFEIYFPVTSTFLVLALCAMKVDMIKHPFHSLSTSTTTINIICLGVCLAGLIIPSAPFYNLATYIYCPRRMTCTFDFYPDGGAELVFVTCATVFCCVAPFLCITALSITIIKSVRAHQAAKDRSPKVAKSTRVVLLVVLAYAVCWSAFFVVFGVAFIYRTETRIPRSFLYWPKFMLMANNAVNPYIYIYSNVNFQKYLVSSWLPVSLARLTKLHKTMEDDVKSKQTSLATLPNVNLTPKRTSVTKIKMFFKSSSSNVRPMSSVL